MGLNLKSREQLHRTAIAPTGFSSSTAQVLASVKFDRTHRSRQVDGNSDGVRQAEAITLISLLIQSQSC